MDKARSRVFLVDDYPPLRASLRKLLEYEKDFDICGEAADLEDAIQGIRESKPDAAIVDLAKDSRTGIEFLKRLKRGGLNVAVLILSTLPESSNAKTLLAAGARGYLMKSEHPETVLAALRCVLRGDIYLSPDIQVKLNQKSNGGNNT